MEDYGIPLGRLFFIGLLSVVLTVDVVMGLQALYYWQLDRAETASDLFPASAKLEKELSAQRALLADYRVEDAEKGVVAVPISRAMRLVVDELSGGKNTQNVTTKESP
jgi:hypothetical protein